jgi:hypothetical protein
MESLLYSMFDNPSFIEELRWLVTKSHFELEYWSPLDTDDRFKADTYVSTSQINWLNDLEQRVRDHGL